MVKFILELSIGGGGVIGASIYIYIYIYIYLNIYINSYYYLYIGHRQIPPPPPRSLIYENNYKTNYI